MSLLPDLPRVLNKREAKITPRVMKWFMEHYPENWVIEVKATQTNTIPKSAVKPHQLKALQAVRSRTGLSHKLSDAIRLTQPFDAFGFKNTQSFVVACFPAKGICLAIHPDEWNGANINSPCEFKLKV